MTVSDETDVLTIRLSPELKDRLQKIATTKGVGTLSGLVRMWLIERAEKEEARE